MISVRMKSSSGSPYIVNVDDLGGGNVRIYCNCKAGIVKKMCKHKAGVITGNPKLLFDPADMPLFEQASLLCAFTIKPLYEAIMEEMVALDAEETEIMAVVAPLLEKIKTRRAAVRDQFARVILGGV